MSNRKYVNSVEQMRKQTQQITADCAMITFYNVDPIAANVITVNGLPIPGNGGFVAFDGKEDEEDVTQYTVVSARPQFTFVLRKKYV